MSALGRLVISHSGMVAAVAVAAIWLLIRPASRTARRFLVFVAVAYGLGSIYAVPYAAGRLLALGYHELAPEYVARGRIAIVLLNADNEYVENWDGQRLAYVDRVAAARLWEAFRIYRQASDAWMIVSEGQPRVALTASPSGAAKRNMLTALGVPPSRLLTDAGAANTHDEAVRLAPLVRSVEPDRVILVTSDTHMRRSLATFRREGIDAVPAVARDPALGGDWVDWLVPGEGGLRHTHEVVHEAVGTVVYAARGWLRF